MRSLLFNSFWILLCLLLASCPNLNLSGVSHCRQYTYNQQQQQWVDSSGNIVSCTIIDNNKIFAYFPDQGCNYLKDHFQGDATVKFSEVPIRVGHGPSPIVQTYCVKQRYIELDNSGQVLLIDKGLFCLKESSEKKQEYVFSSCDGVYRKSSTSSDEREPVKEPAKKETVEEPAEDEKKDSDSE